MLLGCWGRRGGVATAKRLSAEERRALAVRAITIRWERARAAQQQLQAKEQQQ